MLLVLDSSWAVVLSIQHLSLLLHGSSPLEHDAGNDGEDDEDDNDNGNYDTDQRSLRKLPNLSTFVLALRGLDLGG